MKEKFKLDDMRRYPEDAKTYKDVYRYYYSGFINLNLEFCLKTAICGLYLEATDILKKSTDNAYATKTIELLEDFVNTFGTAETALNVKYIDFHYENLDPEQKKLFEKGSKLIFKAFDKRFKKVYQTEKEEPEKRKQEELKTLKTTVQKLKKL